MGEAARNGYQEKEELNNDIFHHIISILIVWLNPLAEEIIFKSVCLVKNAGFNAKYFGEYIILNNNCLGFSY